MEILDDPESLSVRRDKVQPRDDWKTLNLIYKQSRLQDSIAVGSFFE